MKKILNFLITNISIFTLLIIAIIFTILLYKSFNIHKIYKITIYHNNKETVYQSNEIYYSGLSVGFKDLVTGKYISTNEKYQIEEIR